MSPRDNSDQIDPGLVYIDRTAWWDASVSVELRLSVRRKDKIRSVKFGTEFAATWEAVPAWKNDDRGAFGYLWILLEQPDGRYLARPARPLLRNGHNTGAKLAIDNTTLPQPGQRFGVLISGDASVGGVSARSAIREYKRPGVEPPSPPSPSGERASTINVMAPIIEHGESDLKAWLPDLDHFFIECGFEGVHLPCQGALPGPITRQLADRCRRDGKMLIVWMFGQEDDGTAPSDLFTQAFEDRCQAFVAALPGPNVAYLFGYDLQERANEDVDAAQFVKVMAKFTNAPVGARYGTRSSNTAVPTRSFPGSVKSAEWHMAPGHEGWEQQCREWRQVIGDEDGRWGERGRVRGVFKKDPKKEDVAPMIEALVKYNLGGDFAIAGPKGNPSSAGSGRWPPALARDIKKAIGGASSPGDDEMMIIDPEDARSFKLRLGGPRGEESAKTWPANVEAAEVTGLVKNTLPWLIVGVHLFHGKEAPKQDEITSTAYVMDGDHQRPIAKHVSEKDSPGMAFDPSEQIVFVHPYRLRANGSLRLSVRHWNTGEKDGQTPKESNQPHVEALFFAKVER